MKKFWIIPIIVLLCSVQSTFAYNYISWQAQKGQQAYWNYLGIDTDDLSGVVSCSVKGPNMADYILADWDSGRTQWYSRLFYSTVSELQINSVGTWFLKLVYDDTSESIYTFTISGTLEENDFPSVPVILEPAEGDPNVIAEHYDLTWNSNGADADATMLAVEVGGDSFFYSSYSLGVSSMTWHPGWLEIGEAYFRISYLIDHTSEMFTSYPSLVSGPVVNWHFVKAYIASGVKNDFTVKYSLDFDDNDSIDLSDLAVIFSHWLETK